MAARIPRHKPKKLPLGNNAVKRLSSSERGYDQSWRNIRAFVLANEPLCRECKSRGETVAASEVDHIKPLSQGGTHDIGNLQPLCKPCHSRKTMSEDGGTRWNRSYR